MDRERSRVLNYNKVRRTEPYAIIYNPKKVLLSKCKVIES